MSTQVCKIKGYGYKFSYDTLLFSYINDENKEWDFLDVINKEFSYYEFRDWQNDKKNKEPLLTVIIDGMCGEYKYVLYIEEVRYVNNTHFDDYWEIHPHFDDWVKERAKDEIEIFLQRELDEEPQMFEFNHYS